MEGHGREPLVPHELERAERDGERWLARRVDHGHPRLPLRRLGFTGFADNAFGQIPVIDAWDASWPLLPPPRPLIERILATAALRAR